jgi:hypothetical protein
MLGRVPGFRSLKTDDALLSGNLVKSPGCSVACMHAVNPFGTLAARGNHSVRDVPLAKPFADTTFGWLLHDTLVS